MQAPFSVFVNEEPFGLLVLVLTDKDIFVAHEDLEACGIAPLKGRDEVHYGRSLVSLSSVSPPLSFSLDERAIALRITAPPELLPKRVLTMNRGPKGTRYQEHDGGFLNYSARLTNFKLLDIYQELGASHNGDLFLSSMYVTTLLGPVRGLTNYTVNERETLRRLTIGDGFVQTGPLGAAAYLGGLTFQRTYDLNPYIVTSPGIGFTARATTPSTLDVYINGTRVRSEKVSPGLFEVNKLLVGGGAGMVTYVLRDAFGNETRVDMPYYMSGSVLAKGLDEFTYSIGAVRTGIGQASWDYEPRPTLLGRHRYGLSDHLTLAGRIEASDRFISTGPGLTALSLLGQTEIEVAGSVTTQDGPGYAAFLSHAFLSRNFTLGGFGKLTGDHYASIGQAGDVDRVVREFALYGSLPVSRRQSVGVAGRGFQLRDAGQGWSVSTSTSVRLWPAVATSISADLIQAPLSPMGWSVFAVASYVFGERQSASALGRVSNLAHGLDLSASRSLPTTGSGYGYRVNMNLTDTTTGGAYAQYQTSYGRYGAGYYYAGVEQADPHNTGLDAAGGLVMVPKIGFFATLPVQDSFGVIRLPNVKNVRGYIHGQLVGKTDRNGNMVVPNALAYYGNRLSLNPEDVPLKYVLNEYEQTIAPPYRGVAVAVFPIYEPHFYRGTVVINDQGKRVIPEYGQIRVQSQTNTQVVGKIAEVVSPLGELGEFDLEGVIPGVRRAFVDYGGGTCDFDLNAVDSETTVVELGELVCVMPPKPATP